MIFELLKVIIVAFIYGTILVFLGPIIDHAFTDLHKEEKNWEILGEIIAQIITVAVIWYYLNNFILNILHPILHIKKIKSIDTVISISSGLILVGLQTHLKTKLEYITHEHPFRIFQVFEK